MSFPYYTFPYSGEAALDSLDFGICGPVMCCDGVLAVQNQQGRGISLGAVGSLKRIWHPGVAVLNRAYQVDSSFSSRAGWWNESPAPVPEGRDGADTVQRKGNNDGAYLDGSVLL